MTILDVEALYASKVNKVFEQFIGQIADRETADKLKRAAAQALMDAYESIPESVKEELDLFLPWPIVVIDQGVIAIEVVPYFRKELYE